MSQIKHIQPEDLFDSKHFGFSQVVTSPPGTMVFVSGQVGMGKDGKMVDEENFEAQATQAYENLITALKAAGASADDVTMIRVYIPNYKLELAMKLGPIFGKYFDPNKLPAQTMIGVQSLIMPNIMIEIEAMAVVS
jgi:enamine deaminase RidA (YjgF/YER057c/UK114 family)